MSTSEDESYIPSEVEDNYEEEADKKTINQHNYSDDSLLNVSSKSSC